MNKTILTITLSALIAACGGGDITDLGRKRQELDSLKTAYKALGERIKETEAWIVEHDTTVRRNLPTVTADTIVVGPFAHYVNVHGYVRADKAAALYAGGGRVRRILVSPGDRVRKGDLLISIDNDVVAEQIRQAEATVELARTAFEKQERLWQQKIGSEMQYLQAKSQKEQAEAGLAALL